MIKWNIYPEVSPKNGQKIVFFKNSLISQIANFYNDEDEWTGESFPRLEDGTRLDGNNDILVWIDYFEFSNLVL